MGAIAVFDYAAWVALYPEFTNVSQPQATGYFAQACIMHRNDGTLPISDPVVQLALLNMLTAHFAWMFTARDPDGNPSSTGTSAAPALVGRISSASEGSVSVSTEYATATPTMAWFVQTKYGANYWAATAGIRTMHYRRPPVRSTDPYLGIFRH